MPKPSTAEPRRSGQPRNLKPKPEIVVAPLAVSQLNVASVFGIDARRFLELIVPRCRSVARVGKLRVVSADEVQRVLCELAPNLECDGPIGADAVLARLGLRRTSPREPMTADDCLRRWGFTRKPDAKQGEGS